MKLELINDPTVKTTINGFRYTDFDRVFNIPIWKLVYIAEAAFLKSGAKCIVKELDEWRLGGINVSIVGVKYNMTDYFYEKLCHAQVQMQTVKDKIDFYTNYYRCGNSTWDVSVEGFHKGVKLFNGHIKMVIIDRTTRRCKPVPKHLKEHINTLNNHMNEEKLIFHEIRKKASQESFVMDLLVPFSSGDSNLHIGHQEFLKFAHNCGAAASVNQYYRNFEGDLANYKLLNIDSWFKKEIAVNEKITIETWEAEESSKDSVLILHFIIKKMNDEVAAYVTMTFSPDIVNLVDRLNFPEL